MTGNNKKQQNQFSSIIFNIILPVLVLGKLSPRLGENGPLIALFIALAFPIGYGVYDYWQEKNKNMISVLGVINILFTGGLALFKLEGFWFAVKEAAFPMLIGIGVFWSAYTSKPLIKLFIFNDAIVNLQLIQKKLQDQGVENEFFNHLKKLTKVLAISFFLSAILNYVLAIKIFTVIPAELSEIQRANLLNEQIAEMTWKSFFVIALPSTLLLFGILYYLIKGIKKYTGLEMKEILKV